MLLAVWDTGTFALPAAPVRGGGMGEVYRAHDAKLNRDVALKVLLAEVANDPERLTRFRREAQILASLNHPDIVFLVRHGELGMEGCARDRFKAGLTSLGRRQARRSARLIAPSPITVVIDSMATANRRPI